MKIKYQVLSGCSYWLAKGGGGASGKGARDGFLCVTESLSNRSYFSYMLL